MSYEHPLSTPQVYRERELLIVRIHDGTSYHEFGVDTEFLPIDDVQMWTHEFSERTLHELTQGGYLPISLSTFPSKIIFRIHHLMVSLHSPSILRIEDECGCTLQRRVLIPDEFEQQIKWRHGN